jgi:hypothetical protein
MGLPEQRSKLNLLRPASSSLRRATHDSPGQYFTETLLRTAQGCRNHAASPDLGTAFKGTPLDENWHNVVVPTRKRDDQLEGPTCPECRESLRANLQVSRLDAHDVAKTGSPTRVSVIYCGSCGLSLHVEPLQSVQARAGVPVADSADPTTLDGLFQERCRDLIAQIRTMGFEPHVWVDMVNDLGATTAAKRILATNMPLVATRWLIDQDRPELTLEREIIDMRWADLFDDYERAEAQRRLQNPR